MALEAKCKLLNRRETKLSNTPLSVLVHFLLPKLSAGRAECSESSYGARNHRATSHHDPFSLKAPQLLRLSPSADCTHLLGGPPEHLSHMLKDPVSAEAAPSPPRSAPHPELSCCGGGVVVLVQSELCRSLPST